MLANYEKEMKNRMKNSDIRRLEKTLSEVRELEKEFVSFTPSDFERETNRLKQSLQRGIPLDDLLPRAYALALTAIRKTHLGHFELRDVQVMSSIALHYGTCVELGTGEGKTLTAVLPAYLNALTGKKVHIASSNNYLSKRDFDELKPIYDVLGVKSSYVPEELGNGTPEMLQENKEAKKNAYRADICYASNTTFAFDYLKDSTTLRKEDLVSDDSAELGFALIDEVDDILLDSAKIPFIISEDEKIYRDGMNMKDLSRVLEVPVENVILKARELGMTFSHQKPLTYEEAKKIASYGYHVDLLNSEEKYQRYADQFVRNCLYQEQSNNLASKTFYNCDIDGKRGLEFFEIMRSKNPYEEITLSKEERERLATIMASKNLIIHTTMQGRYDFFMTDRGYKTFENYFFRIHLNEHKDLLAKIAPQIYRDERFQQGVDYNIGENNTLFFTELGLEKATKNYSEVKAMRDRFAVSNEYNRTLQLVRNAIDVYLNYQLNREYAVVPSGQDSYAVQVITGGRIAPGRVFSKGYQQAIEIKERVKRRERGITPSKESHTKASITQKGFYSRYEKLSGMSGTSSIYAFGKLYNLRTIEMPRSAHYEFYSDTKKKKINDLIRKGQMKPEERPKCPKKVVQHPDAFFARNEEKYEAIYQSILQSMQKQIRQPILVTTTSVAESERLAAYLRGKGLTNFQLLNALTDKEKEAEIIARAGEVGRITISTEMAGRGTDIKLGGDRDKMIEIALSRFYRNNPKLQNCSKEQKELFRKQMIQALETKKVIVSSEHQKKIHDALSEVGGLKVLCDGHFNLERIDEQVKGRTGRGGEGGEVQFFSSPQDFIRMGTSKEKVKKLFGQLARGENRVIEELNKERKRVQAQNEEELIKHIEDTHELDTVVSMYRNKLRKRRNELILGYERKEQNGVIIESKINYTTEIDQVFEKVIRHLIISHIPDGMNQKSFSFSAKEANLDVEGLALELEAYLGIKVDPNHLYQFESLKEIKDVATIRMQEHHRNLVMQDPIKQRQIDRNILLSYIDKTLDMSAVMLEDMEIQKNLNQIAGYEQITLQPLIYFDTYIQSVERDCLKDAVRTTYGRELSSLQKQRFEQLEEKRNERLQNEDYVKQENKVMKDTESLSEKKKEQVKQTKPVQQEKVQKPKKQDKPMDLNKPLSRNLKIYSNRTIPILAGAIRLVKLPYEIYSKIAKTLSSGMEPTAHHHL